ncbi:MAG: nucleotidyltransferase domain-containing protein [Deltaproteobacteria bacterium]|nr:nucleotidyltransferase domain-containing protein [Deltaproteobacteria bacterium]
MKLEQFVAGLQKIYGANLSSVVLYGSAAGPDFQQKYSDYNLLVILRDLDPRELARSARLCQKWMGWRRKNPPPVFVDQEYLQNSRDVFPIEFLDMKETHQILRGEDPFLEMNVSKEHLRLQCESELKGKILALREAILRAHPSRRRIQTLILRSSSSLFAVFRGFLRLLGEPVPPTKREVLTKLNAKTHLDTAIFEKILNVREGKQKLKRSQVLDWMAEYLTTLKKIARVADSL